MTILSRRRLDVTSSEERSEVGGNLPEELSSLSLTKEEGQHSARLLACLTVSPEGMNWSYLKKELKLSKKALSQLLNKLKHAKIVSKLTASRQAPWVLTPLGKVLAQILLARSGVTNGNFPAIRIHNLRGKGSLVLNDRSSAQLLQAISKDGQRKSGKGYERVSRIPLCVLSKHLFFMNLTVGKSVQGQRKVVFEIYSTSISASLFEVVSFTELAYRQAVFFISAASGVQESFLSKSIDRTPFSVHLAFVTPAVARYVGESAETSFGRFWVDRSTGQPEIETELVLTPAVEETYSFFAAIAVFSDILGFYPQNLTFPQFLGCAKQLEEQLMSFFNTSSQRRLEAS
jgi:DNA-binding HxlR family transcriptional regulator